MSTTVIKKPKIEVYPQDEAGAEDTNTSKDETAQLIPAGSAADPSSPKHRQIKPGEEGHHSIGYGTVVFLMINRSVNLVLYKAFTTFSYYFSQDFGMNYTVFALIAVMNFPGNLLNIAVVPYYNQHKVRYVIVCFELLLAASCLLIIPWHTVTGLLVARFMTGFAITAARSEVNATIGAFTHGKRRTNAIGIVEMSFGFSAMGFLVVGTVLQYFGWKVFFAGSAGLVLIIAVCVMFIIPAWNVDANTKYAMGKKHKKKYSYKQLREALTHKRLQLVFLSVLLNKVARNAFYYTFSKWLSIEYGMGPQQAGYVTLCVAAGCLTGTTVMPLLTSKLHVSIHFACLLGALMQVCSMIIEPIYVMLGSHVSLYGACIIIYFYFCGCQIWYNNCLDIMIGVTPRPVLLPAVNTILLAYGAGGGMIGTIGSTVWYEWGGEAAIALICALSNVGVCAIVILLWIAHKQHPYLPTHHTKPTETTKMLHVGPKQKKQPNYLAIKDEDEEAEREPKVLADSSSMALRIVGGDDEEDEDEYEDETAPDQGSQDEQDADSTPKKRNSKSAKKSKSQSNLQNIDEHETLLHQDNDMNDANRF